jgi:hypothetical protein
MCVPGGRLPTHSACPDCFGFLGGPLSTDEEAALIDEFELLRVTSVQISTNLSLLAGELTVLCRALVHARVSGRYPQGLMVASIGVTRAIVGR